MPKKTYAVTGGTGHVGAVVARRLKERGHQVRLVSRGAGVPIENAGALQRVFTGADGVFLMIPPDVKAANFRRRQNELGMRLAEAVDAAKVRRVVFLSSVGAQLKEGTGPILGLRDMEERLDQLRVPELVHLRPGYFMENHIQGVGLVAQKGIYGTALRADIPIPMIAAADIGTKAAELLDEEPTRRPRAMELLGPRDYTMAEAARILGAAIGRPGLKYLQFTPEGARRAMLDMGLSASFADALLEMSRLFNEGGPRGTQTRTPENTTSTTLERFAQETFREAYERVPAGVR